MTTEQRTHNAIANLLETAQILRDFRDESSHAFWLHTDHKLIEECDNRLSMLIARIEDEKAFGTDSP